MKLYVTLIMSFFVLITQAQQVTVSEPLSLKNNAGYHLIGSMKGHVLVLKNQDVNYEVEAFDQNLRQSWAKPIELDKHRPEILDVIADKDRFSIIYRFKRKGHYFIKMHQYDPAANLTDSLTLQDMGPLFFAPNQEVVVSENKEMALVYHIERLTRIKALMIDLRTPKLLWETSFEPEDFFPALELKNLLADNDGNMHIVLDKNNRKSQLENHRFEIYSFGPFHDEITRAVLHMENYFTFDALFTFDNVNQTLVGAGLYSEENVSRAKGYFFLKHSMNDPASYFLKMHPFDDVTVSTLLGKGVDKNKGVPEINIREIVLRLDGGILLIGERNKIYERQSASLARSSAERFSRYIVDYYYDDIFLASLHPDGSKHWENILHKKQYSQDDGAVYSSYFLMKKSQNLRLVFNDEIRNENTVSEYIVSPDGQLERKSLFNTESQELKLRFRDGHQVSANEFVVPSERRNRLKLVRVSF